MTVKISVFVLLIKYMLLVFISDINRQTRLVNHTQSISKGGLGLVFNSMSKNQWLIIQVLIAQLKSNTFIDIFGLHLILKTIQIVTLLQYLLLQFVDVANWALKHDR